MYYFDPIDSILHAIFCMLLCLRTSENRFKYNG